MATWNPSDRDAAIARGQSGGKLSSYEREKLIQESRQAGKYGRAAKEALDKGH